MDNVTPQNHSPLLGLICTAFGHDYSVRKNITDQINHYECVCCGKQSSLNQLFDQV